MIAAGEMLSITDRNRNNQHVASIEQYIIQAALQGKDCIEYPNLPYDQQVELLRAGYKIDFNTDKEKLISYISWRDAH